MPTSVSLTSYEFEQVKRRCRGTALSSQPPGFNRKPFLVRLLKETCPDAAAKIKRMTSPEVEALCARVSEPTSERPAQDRWLGGLRLAPLPTLA